jgi:hypothetical protein
MMESLIDGDRPFVRGALTNRRPRIAESSGDSLSLLRR